VVKHEQVMTATKDTSAEVEMPSEGETLFASLLMIFLLTERSKKREIEEKGDTNRKIL
jgi:hypothetical protein